MNIRPSLKQVLSIGGASLVMISTAVLFQNCAKHAAGISESSTSAGTNTPTGVTNPSNNVQAAASFNLGTVASQSGNLGTQIVVPVQITAQSGYNGTARLSIEESDLRLLDTGAAITFSFSPATVTLSSGASQMVQLTINVDTMAPSFANKSFHVIATDSVNNTLTASVTVPLTVVATYNVTLQGPVNANAKSPEHWSMAIGATAQFIAHSEGLNINFVNMDKSVHLIHSTGGAIAHESTTAKYTGTNTIGLPPSPDNGVTAGGVYNTKVMPSIGASTSIVYCHDDEASTQGRTLKFNVAQPTVPTAPTTLTPIPTTNANATYTYLATNVFSTSCVGCHSATSAAAGVNLSTYAGVRAALVPDDAADSSLYLSVSGTSPSMPQGGTPLSTTQLKNLSDWINAGDQNN